MHSLLYYKCIRWGERFIRSRSALSLLPLSWLWSSLLYARHCCYDWGILPSVRVYRAQEGFVNLDFASQSRIDSHFEHHSQVEKGEKQNRLCAGAASPNSPNLTERGIALPVVSIGNLAVGGTGKTPLVIALAKQFAHRRVAILARGYGGDEMRVIARHVPTAKLYEDPDRVQSAHRAIAEGAELLILDDGFQHRRLHRDFDCLIVRAEDRQGRCLPAGDLRDLPRRQAKADQLFSYDRGLGIRLEARVRRLLTLQGQEIPSLEGQRIGMFCGIANPHRFKKTIEELGAVVVRELVLADHEPIGIERLSDLHDSCKSLNVNYLVCTEKDAVKLPPLDLPVIYPEIETVILEGVDRWQKLIAKIEERMNN